MKPNKPRKLRPKPKPTVNRKLTSSTSTVKKPTKGRATPVPSTSTVNKTAVHQQYLRWYSRQLKAGKSVSKKNASDWWSGKATPAERKRWGV
jgi:hypothetical protein